MFKRRSAAVLVLCIVIQLFSVTAGANGLKNDITVYDGYVDAAATSGTCGDNLTWKVSTAGTLTISGTGAMDNYNYFVYSPWSEHYLSIKKIVIKSGVTTIGDEAFYDCEKAVSVTIPDTVKSIGSSAFCYCNSLVSVTIPNSVTAIEDAAFRYCGALETVKFGSAVKTIGDKAFRECASLTSIVIPSSVTKIGAQAFWGCSGVTSVDLGANVKTVGEYAFNNCTGLSSVKFGTKVTSVANYAFYACNSLNGVTLPASLTTIGEYAFGYVSSSQKVSGFTVTGTKGSGAEKYANANGFLFTDPTVEIVLPSDHEFYMDTASKTMPNVKDGATVSDAVSAANVTVSDKDGNVLGSDAAVGTGCKATTASGDVYTVIMKGDVNGTGTVDATDLILLKRCLMGSYALEGVWLHAGNVDGSADGLQSTDLILLKRYLMGSYDLYA